MMMSTLLPLLMMTTAISENFVSTRPEPAYSRHGLGLDLKVSLCRLARFGGPQLTCFGQKKRNVINRGPKLTSFGPKNVMPLTGGPN